MIDVIRAFNDLDYTVVEFGADFITITPIHEVTGVKIRINIRRFDLTATWVKRHFADLTR